MYVCFSKHVTQVTNKSNCIPCSVQGGGNNFHNLHLSATLLLISPALPLVTVKVSLLASRKYCWYRLNQFMLMLCKKKKGVCVDKLLFGMFTSILYSIESDTVTILLKMLAVFVVHWGFIKLLLGSIAN